MCLDTNYRFFFFGFCIEERPGLRLCGPLLILVGLDQPKQFWRYLPVERGRVWFHTEIRRKVVRDGIEARIAQDGNGHGVLEDEKYS